jgi:hypothetical protein
VFFEHEGKEGKAMMMERVVESTAPARDPVERWQLRSNPRCRLFCRFL